jgi:hypothetical protein
VTSYNIDKAFNNDIDSKVRVYFFRWFGKNDKAGWDFVRSVCIGLDLDNGWDWQTTSRYAEQLGQWLIDQVTEVLPLFFYL